MSSQKKKLETAIDNLFSAPHPRVQKSMVEDPHPPVLTSLAPAEVKIAAEPAAVEPPPIPVAVVSAPPFVPPAPQAPVPAPVILAVAPPPAVQPARPVQPTPSTVAEPPAPSSVAADAKPETQAESLQMVIFTLDEQYYGITIDTVESIIKVQAITRLPHVPNYILGLTNLRGRVLPVFNLRRRFGLPDQETNKHSRIIVIHLDREEAGLMVDSVSEVQTVSRENLEPAPSMTTTISARYITGVAKLPDRLVILLDLAKVITANT
jgi:purine-binding chemotaxis protein CheW